MPGHGGTPTASPRCRVWPCQTRQTDFAYVKTTHRSGLSYSPMAASATAWGWGQVSSEALGSSREHSGAWGGTRMHVQVREPAGLANAGGLRAPGALRCGVTGKQGQCRAGTGFLCTRDKRRCWDLGGQQHPRSSSGRRAAPAHAVPRRGLCSAPATAAPAPRLDHSTSTGRAPGQREPGVSGEGDREHSPPTPGQGSCCHGIAAFQHPTPRGCPPPSAPSKPSRCISASLAHGLQRRAAPRQRRGGAVQAHPGEGWPRGVSAPGEAAPDAAGGGERSVRRGKRAGGLSLLPAPPQGSRARVAGGHRAQGAGASSQAPRRGSGTVGPGVRLGTATLLPGRGLQAAVLGLAAGLALPGTGGGGSAGLWCSVRGTLYIFIYKQGQQCCDVAMRNSCSGAGCSRKIWCCSSNGEIRGTAKAR